MTTTQQHLSTIDAWVEEACADQGYSADEIYSDIVHAYLDSEIGSNRRVRAEILRATGCMERR